MFDLHFDLLSILLFINRFFNKEKEEEVIKCFQPLNVTGVFANLYFMSEEEMKTELGIMKEELNVVSLFKKAKALLLKTSFQQDIIYSIEGCDYITSKDELLKLKTLGLHSILLVWNHQNKYGGGIQSNIGLTESGKDFLRYAIDLSLGIDLSHMNEKTFFDTILLIKEEQSLGKKVICYASHSNSRKLVDHPRNLTDEQLFALKEVGGMIGVVSYPFFAGDRKGYIEQISYMVDIFGPSRVMVSSDDMTNLSKEKNLSSKYQSIYPYSSIKKELEKDLLTVYSKEIVKKILEDNARVLYNRLKGDRT